MLSTLALVLRNDLKAHEPVVVFFKKTLDFGCTRIFVVPIHFRVPALCVAHLIKNEVSWLVGNTLVCRGSGPRFKYGISHNNQLQYNSPQALARGAWTP